jgi:hypothetical protein
MSGPRTTVPQRTRDRAKPLEVLKLLAAVADSDQVSRQILALGDLNEQLFVLREQAPGLCMVERVLYERISV